jgi:murein DD-endopeptidase MepM/ murein hydrolase activator NlpD
VRVRSFAASLLAAAAMTAASLAPASADNLWDQKDNADSAVSAARQDLESSSAAVSRAAAALADVSARLPAVRAAYADALGRMQTARDQLTLVRQRLRSLRAQQDALERQVASAQRQITQTESLIGDIVRQQYQSGGMQELAVVLNASSPSDFVQRLLTTQQVLQSQSEVVDQLTVDKALLAGKQQQLQVTQDGVKQVETQALEQFQRLQELAQKARTAQQEVEVLVARRADALEVAREQRAAEKRRYEIAVRAQQQLQQQIAAATSNGGSTSTGSGTSSGVLLWPVPGPMVQGVGWRVHPVYGYRSCHTGIDISAGTGTPIKAAADGVVVWTNPDDGGPYGNNTLVDHGNGLSTFYAHQSAFNVSPGQRVRQGEVIGFVGSTGYATGPHLHFEVHINGVPYDPMGWFGGSRTSQSQFCPGS